jgi:hypothetical protein
MVARIRSVLADELAALRTQEINELDYCFGLPAYRREQA